MVGDISKFRSMASGALVEESRKGSAQVFSKVGEYFKSISERFLTLPGLKKVVFVTTIVAALTTFNNQSHAWSKETSDKFLNALNTSKSLKVLMDSTSALSDSAIVNKNLIQIDSLSSNLKAEISEAIIFMNNDFNTMIKLDMADDLRKDVETFKKFAGIVGDITLKKKASDLKKYVDGLVIERILAEKVIGESVKNANNGHFKKAEKEVNTLLKKLNDYPHLNNYIYLKGVMPVLVIFGDSADRFSSNGQLDEADQIVKLAEDIANHENIDTVKTLTFDEIIMPMREDVAHNILNEAERLSNNSKFDEAEVLIKRVEKKYSEQTELIANTTHNVMINRLDVIELAARNGKFGEAKDLIEETKTKYPSYGQDIKGASYNFGNKLVEEVKVMVRNNKYEEAYKFLKYWEKNHFKGRMKSVREELARTLEIQARGSPSTSGSKNKLDWANKFRK